MLNISSLTAVVQSNDKYFSETERETYVIMYVFV